MAPLLPKLRGHFAEFLNHSSPDRLSILYLTTCVGFGYGPYIHIARGFSRQHRITNFPKYGYASRLTLYVLRIYLEHGPHAYTTISITWHGYLPASPHHLATTSSGPQHHTHQPTQKASKRRVFRWVSIPDSPWARTHGYGNINPLSIDYACRPRLRPRLTLGGLTWPRNP